MKKTIGKDHREKFVLDNPDIVELLSKEPSGDLFMVNYSIYIQDTGMGITKEGLTKLFKEKNSLAEHSEVNSRGTGFGLYIVR